MAKQTHTSPALSSGPLRGTRAGSSKQITLISAPWPIFSRPSIQLGVLKAYLKSRYPDLVVICHHFFLQVALSVGYPVYQAVSERVWPAECVYAAMLYPERADEIEALFARTRDKQPALQNLDFNRLVRQVKDVTDAFLDQVDWPAMDLAGVSVCLCQLSASLYLIRGIRKRAPHLPLIAGGPVIGGDYAADYLEAFPELDMVVCGEGERPLAALIEHLRAGGVPADFNGEAAVVNRWSGSGAAAVGFSQMSDLRALPVPDFGEYFALLKAFPAEKKFFPTLPAEISRGCWWQARDPATGEKGCAFCNLNLQWTGYRRKSAGQAASEVKAMSDRHQLLSFAYMDNSLPPMKSREVFGELAGLKKDFRFFSEIRASTDRRTLSELSSAGMSEVQIGIEALSDTLLKKLNKGTSAIENLEVMKNCEALGIKHKSNLIIHFPGSDAGDVEETLRVIGFARLFYPLRVVRFWLGLKSPVWQHPRKFGIRAVFNHPNYRVLFPDDVCRRVHFMIQDYRGDKTVQQKLWKPVVQAVKQWREDYFKLHSAAHADPGDGPILSYQDGGDFLILRRRRAGREPENHRLAGTSREIYLFCETRRSFEAVCARFPGFSAEQIRNFLAMMQEKRLMFSDKGWHLSLAAPLSAHLPRLLPSPADPEF